MPDLMQMAEEIEVVPPSAARDYNVNKELLTDEVNRIMTAGPSVKELIGLNPLAVMYDNHANHANFMSNVFLLNDYQLIMKIITWVYRSYVARGFSIDYFPATLNTWIKVIEKELEPSSASHIVSVYRWIIEKHHLFKEASEQQTVKEAAPDAKWSKIQFAFYNALLAGNHQ